MGSNQSVTTDDCKYSFEERDKNRLGRGGFGVVYKGRGPKVGTFRSYKGLNDYIVALIEFMF